MDKFYFYSSYARPICKLNHNEAGQVVKAICAFIFHDKEPSEKTLPKAKALFYLLYEQLSEAKKKQIKSAKRGKIGSTARHVEAAEYTANEIMTNARASAEATKKQAEQYLDGIVQSVESTADKPIPTKRKHAEEEIKTLRTQNAALQKSLDIKSKDAADLFTQLQRAERLGRGKDSAFRMVSDMIAAYPDEFDELLKKSREKKATPHYKANSRGNDRGGK